MKDFCKTMTYITTVFGIIGSFVIAYMSGKSVSVTKYGVRSSRDWTLTILLFIACIFSTLILTAIMGGIAAILEELERMKIKIADLPAKQISAGGFSKESQISALSGESEKDKIMRSGGWRCPECNKINYSYISTCTCGHPKI